MRRGVQPVCESRVPRRPAVSSPLLSFVFDTWPRHWPATTRGNRGGPTPCMWVRRRRQESKKISRAFRWKSNERTTTAVLRLSFTSLIASIRERSGIQIVTQPIVKCRMPLWSRDIYERENEKKKKKKTQNFVKRSKICTLLTEKKSSTRKSRGFLLLWALVILHTSTTYNQQ